ncbi:Uncharacterized protein HSRCO_0408 [Halanaeroarchaeum sp. HSR-CO]|uniref:hypothetical protein n=1 Tax=Halanaeroarchaeum sp. HSR-CO TaxID=2866382 RepID=UPI00217D5050|nr:hypothetical protein [Halanaeroarchaeum sp. HSR-CO]UWG46705.1 Uncharacterized protein HSRCO_0408 [Halanaeroarchaeum sp. HSR-CO]
MVTVSAEVLSSFPRFSRYNSPYPAHDAGTAVDLYPDSDDAPSPVAGEVVETRTVTCPDRSYAAAHDHLIVVDTGEHLARVLHVDPGVEPGEVLSLGDSLGRLVRSGYFAPWVDNHIHLGFRDHGTNAVRATGSLPLSVDVPLEAVPWDGTGTVVDTGETYAILDAPAHPDPGAVFAGIADDSGSFVLDGGLPHYEWGGRLATESATRGTVPDGGDESDPVHFLGERVGTAQGEVVHWRDVTVLANGGPIYGLSFFLGRESLYAKLIDRHHSFSVGADVVVDIEA